VKTTHLLLGASLCLGGSIWAIQSMPALVNNYGESEVKLSPYFDECVADIHLLIRRSYLCSKRDAGCEIPETAYRYYEGIFQDMILETGTMDYFPDASDPEGHALARYPFEHTWLCKKTFMGEQGRTQIGSFFENTLGIQSTETDFPGFIALKRGENGHPDVLVVVLRGSQAESFQPLHGMLGSSWRTNYAVGKEKLPKAIFGFKGSMHYGFLEKELAFRQTLLHSIYDTIINEQVDIDNLIIVVTGHSQGGALAQITIVDLVKNLGPLLFGNDFDNAKHNRFYGYFMSPARVAGSKSTVRHIHDLVGKHNMIRHSTIHDPVPNAGIDRIFERIAILDPINAIFAYHNIGYLALDDSGRVLEKALASEASYPNKYDERLFTEFNRDRYLMVQIVKNKLFDSYKCHLKAKGCSRLMPKYHYWSTKSDLKMARAIFRAGPLGGLYWMVSCWHFGSRANNEGGYVFDPVLPDKNIDIALIRGRLHKMAKTMP